MYGWWVTSAGVQRAVYTSSVAVLGIDKSGKPSDEDTPVTIDDMVGHYKRSKFLAEEAVMKKLGLDFQVLDSGCCGMAGSFGFIEEKYDVSMKCAERVLLPAVRNARGGTLVVADGFSCREQLLQTSDAQPLHLAQVLRMALHQQ